MLPFGSSGLVQATIMLSDVIASALICSGGPGTVRRTFTQNNFLTKKFITRKIKPEGWKRKNHITEKQSTDISVGGY